MSRLFDALRKAEGSREPGPTVLPGAVGARPAGRPGEVVRSAMPLLGAVEVNEDVVRAMASLRIGLETALVGRGTRSVMFLSPQGGEGTSTVALQFAQVLARDSGARPLVIDCNARRPAYRLEDTQRCAVLDRRLMAGPPSQVGVVASNLYAVPVTQEAGHSGMIQAAALREIVDANSAGFDWVILDGPPVLDSPDAAALAGVADGVVLVLQAGRTKRPVMSRASELLTKSGARILGTVLNRRVLEIPGFIYRRI